MAAGTSANQPVRGLSRASTLPMSDRPDVTAAVPICVAPSEDGGHGGTATPALDAPAGNPRLNPRPGDVIFEPDDQSGSNLGPRAIERRPGGRGDGAAVPRNQRSGVAGPAASAAVATAAPLKWPARRRRWYSVEAHGPQSPSVMPKASMKLLPMTRQMGRAATAPNAVSSFFSSSIARAVACLLR